MKLVAYCVNVRILRVIWAGHNIIFNADYSA